MYINNVYTLALIIQKKLPKKTTWILLRQFFWVTDFVRSILNQWIFLLTEQSAFFKFTRALSY